MSFNSVTDVNWALITAAAAGLNGYEFNQFYQDVLQYLCTQMTANANSITLNQTQLNAALLNAQRTVASDTRTY